MVGDRGLGRNNDAHVLAYMLWQALLWLIDAALVLVHRLIIAAPLPVLMHWLICAAPLPVHLRFCPYLHRALAGSGPPTRPRTS